MTAELKSPARILVVDDDPEHNEAIVWRLRREGYQTESALSGRACMDQLSAHDFSAVLLDYNLGDTTGLDVLTRIRASRSAAELPVLFVTGEAESELTVEALRSGANDYIVKPVDLDVTMERLRTHIAIRTANDDLQHRALHDALTGLPNRALLADRLATAVARGQRSGCLVAVFLLDLDGFKAVNDTHGHGAGDSLLKSVSQRLLKCARQSDTVARLGGDEFVVLADDLEHESDTDSIVQRIGDALGAPVTVDHHRVQVHASIGVHIWHPGEPSGLETLLEFADAAMYENKRKRKAVTQR